MSFINLKSGDEYIIFIFKKGERRGLLDKRKEYTQLLQMSVKRIVSELSDKVEKISLFGSFSKRSDLFTDLDILIIMKTEKPFLERLKEIYSLLSLPVDADILCYTPEEFEKIKNRGFFKKILAEEVILYEKRTD
ncbi:MAG: nucleotidyltransferase domain-containing protein [Nitrososphaerales archaeon]